ncbi:MAG TPA: PDDEXK nuclease domain-containing protein [Chitinispirillaceae bacterium]|nr:PDDEXK nuclease domain-containing protein [Chitinispirillaceae bacterium]
MSNFEQLLVSIHSLNDTFRNAALHSVSKMFTIRNWLIGWYIVEYEQHGEDRAKYGENMIQKLSSRMAGKRGFSERNLRSFREFYRFYPHFSPVIINEIAEIGVTQCGGLQSVSGEIPVAQIWQSVTAKSLTSENREVSELSPPCGELLRHFSFTHFIELMRIADPLKRAFYEIEGIAGCWSVPQLKRQIESLLYERTGLSKDKKGLVDAVHAENQKMCVDDIIRDPYILEFTGFPERYQFSENDLESSLLDHIQSFLIELGNGFCFEARQKRITLDNEHDRIDLVFYHRILRCHVLIDLKVKKFTAGDAGQMNFYLNYYRENMMVEGDNPPVGLILCTDRDETRVKYATSGLDNTLFVSKYLTQLPSADTLREFLEGDRERTILKLQEERAVYR